MTQRPELGLGICKILGRLHCYPSFGRRDRESLALLGDGGQVSPAEIAGIIGGQLPIRLWELPLL